MKRKIGNIKKIAVFRALQLGDMLCAISAIRALRLAYPDAEITLLGLPWAVSFVKRFSKYFDDFIIFPGYPGLPEQTFDQQTFELFLEEVRKRKFDLLIQMQGNGTIVNPLMLEFGATQVAGFYNENSQIDSSLFMRYPGDEPEIHRHLLLMKYLGIESNSDHLEFPLTQHDKKEFNDLKLPAELKKYVCIHPGSRGYWRQWPPKYFAAIADHCVASGFTVVITGTTDERDITREVIKCMHHSPVDLTGKTSLGALAVLIKNAFALVSNCTGVSHIADAFDTPSVIISMDGEPERWSPLNKKLHRVVDWTKEHYFETVLLKTQSLFQDLLLPQKINAEVTFSPIKKI